MSNRRLLAVCATAFLVALLGAVPTAFGQGGTTSTISGVVLDSGGGVIPGADVTIKQSATGLTQATVTNDQGIFSFPGLNIGTYTVTITLSGFKTFVANDVVISSASPANVKAVLEVGGLEETITVESTAAIVQTQATTIAQTVNVNQITKLPLTTRAALDFVTLLPGVTTAGGNRQSQVNGLPQGLINITLDGVNVQDNTLRSTDGFFAIVNPRLDAIEEVSVSTAAQGSDAGQGAVQVRFVTRSGSNTFTGSGYYYMRRDRFNNNTWFNERDNIAKPKLKQDQIGARAGGPIYIPKLFDGRNKAFFFMNWEEFRQPSDVTRNRTVLNTLAQQGIYSYATSSGAIQQVNLLQLAAANGHIATVDPTTTGVLADIRAAVSGGSLTDLDPNLQRFSFNVPVETMRRYPTVRIDYNFTSNHRFSSAWNYQKFSDYPDTLNSREYMFPGFPVAAGQSSIRQSWSNTLRSTFRSNLVNEVRVGYSGSPVTFYSELTPAMWSATPANQGGFQLNLGTIGSGLTNASAAPNPQARNAYSLLIEDNVNWLKGKHGLNMGVSYTQYTYWGWFETMVPTVSFGLVTGDPALAMFNTTNFPGAASTNLTAAQNLYALLVGRVSTITGNARLDEDTNEYTYVGRGMQRARMPEFGFFAQDSWRLRPDFTVNLGVRYGVQLPFYPLNDSFSYATLADLCGISGVSNGSCNMFQAGVLTGKSPEFQQYKKGTKAYDVDWNNIAPSVGVAWTTGGQGGFLGKLLGQQGDSVLRGGYSRAYSRGGMNDFTGRIGGNPGLVINVSRNAALGNLGTLPLLYRDKARLEPPAFPQSPVYPMKDDVTGDVSVFDAGLQVPYADSFSVGLQRSLGRSMALEVRYVGTRSRDGWLTLNHNEINIFDNGFFNEFRAAQANLQANIAAGRGANFRYYGAGTGTSPLPIMLAYFSGVSAANAGDPARYTSANFASNTFVNPLATYNPNAFSFASNLYTNATLRGNAVTGGLPVNFFIVNPELQGGANLAVNRNETNYNALQIELRRRLSGGLQFQTSYALGKMMQSRFETFRRDDIWVRDVGSPGDISQVFKANVVYDLPFGQGQKFASNANNVVDRIINGWTVSLVARIQSGQLVDLGNVRLVGMTADEVTDLYKIRFDANNRVWILPQDVIDNTIKAYSVSATSPTGYGTLGPPTGKYFAPANGPDCYEVDNGGDYGDCGVRSLVVSGPLFQEYDITISKRIRIKGRTNMEFRAEILNAFNNTNFVPVSGIGNQIASYEITGLTGQNVARVMQFILRFNW